MGKHRDEEMSGKRGDGGALGPDEGTPRKKRAEEIANPTGGAGAGHDGGGLGPDEGTPRSDAGDGKHAEFGDGAHKHSNHMPTTGDQPNC